MLIYHDDEKSPNCFKTKILLYELDVPFEQMNHDFLQGDLKTDTFMGKFPNSKVPALEDGPVHISESGAIALYLADKYGKLMPTALPQHALMYQALNLESAHLAPPAQPFSITTRMDTWIFSLQTMSISHYAKIKSAIALVGGAITAARNRTTRFLIAYL